LELAFFAEGKPGSQYRPLRREYGRDVFHARLLRAGRSFESARQTEIVSRLHERRLR
jgi:hypothetical protein